jgi:protein TonB
MLTIEEERANDARRQQHLREVIRLTHEKMVSESAHKEKFADNSVTPSGAEQSWDEMVFENRNREYGAYLVRKGYNKNLVTAVIATLIVFILILLYPSVSKWLGGNDVPIKDPPRKLVYTELSAPPPIDKPKPPPPQVQLPRLQKIIKFVPPKVVKEEVREVLPTIEEIKVNETGAEAVEGPTDVIFDEPVAEVVGGESDDELFTVVDQQPEYAGGYDAMMAFIRSNMTYPANARRMRIEGTVHVSFIVSKTGEISEVRVLRGIMTECDREAVRVVQMMPPWKPGKQNGRPVNVRFILPLKFRLN